MKIEEREAAIKKIYASMKERYELPDLEDLQREFNISFMDLDPDEKTLLITIRGGMINILKSITNDVESIVSGSDRYCCNIERREFSKEDRKELFETYVKMQQIFWKGRLVFLQDDSAIAKWIEEFYKTWKKEIKEKIIWYTKKMYMSWVDIKRTDTDLKYVG